MIATMIFVGETRFFVCTGVLIGRHKSITRILTSASLVRFANKNEIDRSLKVCTANRWERRPSPPFALGAFDSISSLEFPMISLSAFGLRLDFVLARF